MTAQDQTETVTCPVRLRPPTDPEQPFDEAFHADPHSVLAWFRQHRPVTRVRMPNGLDAWLVTRYDDVRAALADPRLVNDTRRYPGAWKDLNWYSPAGDMISAYGRNLSSADPPEHDLFQKPIVGAFTTKRAESLRPRIRRLVHGLLDDLADRGEGDIVGDFAIPLSVTVMSEIVGIPEADQPVFLEFVRRTASVDEDGDVDALRAVAQRTFELLTGYVAGQRPEPGPGLVGDVFRMATEHGYSDNDAVTVLYHLFVAGFDTTAAFIGNAVEELLSRPALLAALRQNPALVPAAVEELLRHDGSARLGVWRFTATEISLGGQRIPEGELVLVSLNAANRDDTRFTDPDGVHLDRDTPHLAFGRGRHHCTGAALSRVESQEALTALIERFPALTLAVAPERLRRRSVVTLNGRSRLPVRLR